MAACETCWSRASQDALLRGGSIVDHYRRRLAEQDEHPDHEPTTATSTTTED